MIEVIAYCGYTCNLCPVFIVTQEGDEARRIALAKEYSNENYQLSPEDINCHGCTMTDENKLFKFCMECEIRLCGLEKGIENCGHCSEYPCRKLDKPFEMSIKNKEALDRIRAGLL